MCMSRSVFNREDRQFLPFLLISPWAHTKMAMDVQLVELLDLIYYADWRSNLVWPGMHLEMPMQLACPVVYVLCKKEESTENEVGIQHQAPKLKLVHTNRWVPIVLKGS